MLTVMMITSVEAAELISSFVSGATLVVTLVVSAKTGNKVRYSMPKRKGKASKNRNNK